MRRTSVVKPYFQLAWLVPLRAANLEFSSAFQTRRPPGSFHVVTFQVLLATLAVYPVLSHRTQAAVTGAGSRAAGRRTCSKPCRSLFLALE